MKGGSMTEGKAIPGVNKSTNTTLSKTVQGGHNTMLKTGSKAKGKLRNFSKLAVNRSVKGGA